MKLTVPRQGVPVKELLSVMTVRLSMQEKVITNPPPSVKNATRQLVEKLKNFEPDDLIEIRYTTEPLRAKYLHGRTGEVLAEIVE